MRDEVGGLLQARPQCGFVGDDLHLHGPGLLRGEVHEVQLPAGLVHEVRGADGGEVHVEGLEVRELPDGRRRGVVGVEVVSLVGVAVADEVERGAVPHGLAVAGAVVAHPLALVGLHVEEVDAGDVPAPVALPRPQILAVGHVGQPGPVGREGPELAVGHGQHLGQAAGGLHFVELGEAVCAGGHGARVEERLAVGRPAQDSVRRGVVGDPQGRAAHGRHHVDVGVPFVVAREGDLRTIGGELWVVLVSFRRGQALGHAAILRSYPDVPGVDEREMGGRDGGLLEEAGVHLGGQRGRPGGECEEKGEADQAHGIPSLGIRVCGGGWPPRIMRNAHTCKKVLGCAGPLPALCC